MNRIPLLALTNNKSEFNTYSIILRTTTELNNHEKETTETTSREIDKKKSETISVPLGWEQSWEEFGSAG